MPRIFDFNLQVHDRLATVASILALKESGQKFVETTAESAADAAAAEAAGIEMVVADPPAVSAVREGSKRLFVTAAIDFVSSPPVTTDEVLRASIDAMEHGADAVHTSRSPETVRRLADEKIPVMCHVGFVPRQSSRVGGIRAVGKTADEAKQIWDEIRRLEEAGAFAVECELLAAPMMSEITRRTRMATISLGSGPDANIMGLFMSDVCGIGDRRIPRHARVYADLNAMYKKIEAEKLRALQAFRADVASGSFPSEEESVSAPDDEVARFVELIET